MSEASRPPKTPNPYWDAIEARPSERTYHEPQWPQRTGLSAWEIDDELRPWQERALAAWEKHNRRGVIEAATGTGKTLVALAAAARVRAEHGRFTRVAVVVPTQALARQWRRAFVATLGLDERVIAEEHSASRQSPEWGHEVVIMVINTARTRLQDRVANWERSGRRVLVVVDECHRAGSEHNSAVVRTEASYALGLSATPERSDRGHDDHVYPGIGPPVYRYPLITALDDDVLAPLVSVNLYVDMTGREAARWRSIGRELGQALERLEREHPGITDDPVLMWTRISRLAALDDAAAKAVVARAAERRDLLTGASERWRCAEAITEWLVGSGLRGMVFHETIAAAERMHQGFVTLGAAAELEHSQLRRGDRDASLERFRRDKSRYLVAVRSLDEGLDVPDASVAVIAAGSRSPRQRIQRLGRILRAAEGKKAVAVSILVRGTPEEELVGARDEDLLGSSRVVHHRWPGRSVADAVDQRDSSYQPHASPRDNKAEQVTRSSLGLALDRQRAQPGHVRPSGGYDAKVQSFAVNAWHRVDEVRDSVGMPTEEFDLIRPEIRRAYALRLDARLVDDPTIIHGTEVEAIVRSWKHYRRR